jgi:N-acetylmuramoyl-L-alanine amidase
MPAVLTENGFYNNLREAKEMMDDSVRQKIADAHVSAILYIEKHGF